MKEAGILLPIFSLPSPYGIGCFDKEAYRFVDQLKTAKQSAWQILPLGMTGFGDSPYQSFSTFAGNPYFISLTALHEKGYLTQDELPDPMMDTNTIDYSQLYRTRYTVLRKAFSRFIPSDKSRQWMEENTWWLRDFVLFMTIKSHYEGKAWHQWPNALRNRDPRAVSDVEIRWQEDIRFFSFLQYEFWTQWHALKTYANARGIRIIGDIPIYVAYDSADVWSHRTLFQLDADGEPSAIAGVPPDGFSITGQLWGNPLYDWPVHQQTNYTWWTQRMKAALQAYDTVRIDHFRGFDEYYSIPYGEQTAKKGTWKKGPGTSLFKTMSKQMGHMSVIAEDLGYLTDSVTTMLADCGYPGMKIFEFAFDVRDSSSRNLHMPHRYPENCVAYTGTHDNETMMGWFSSITFEETTQLMDYLKTKSTDKDKWLDWCIDTLMASNAKLCIIPIQDWLHLDNTARINTPSTLGTNWKWRLTSHQINKALLTKIAHTVCQYERAAIQKTAV